MNAEQRAQAFEDALLQKLAKGICDTRLRRSTPREALVSVDPETVGGLLSIDEILDVAHAVRAVCPTITELQAVLGRPDESGVVRFPDGVLPVGEYDAGGTRIVMRPGDVVEVSADYREAHWRLFHLENSHLARRLVSLV